MRNKRPRRRRDDGSAPALVEPPRPKPPLSGGAEVWPDDDGFAAGMDERCAFAMGVDA